MRQQGWGVGMIGGWGEGVGTLVRNVTEAASQRPLGIKLEAEPGHPFLHSWLSGDTGEARKDGVSPVAWRFSFSLPRHREIVLVVRTGLIRGRHS